jgi:hypothetical protein
MGVLEDAIREHLELKRQHGASEEEVVRQETEVLGQARRQAAAAEGEEEEAAQAAEELPEGDDEVAAVAMGDLAEPPESPYADEGEAEFAPPDTEESAAVDPAPASYEAPFEGGLEDEDPPPRDQTVILDDPVEFDELEPGSAPPMPVHDEEEPRPGPVDAADPDSEDVLEETPEFLQETPEHDRLWFEQKPPRDFDFD